MISSLRLAKICGVSQGTVDRALHNRPEISVATREKILRTARKYGYQPHPAARELLGGQSRMVGAIIPSINSIFFLDLLNEVKRVLAPAGLRLLLAPVADAAECLEVLADFAARRSRAVILIPPEPALKLPSPLAKTTRIISLVQPCQNRNVCFLAPDEERTGCDAVGHLAARGHRRIIHLTYSRRSWAIQARARGYSKAMRGRGLKPVVLVAPDERDLLRALHSTRATALFCHNDWLALSALRILERNRIRVPQQVSVLGVDASPTFTALYPDITSLRYPFEALARQTLQVIQHGRPRGVIQPMVLAEKRTVGPCPRT